ncbi:MAG: hypothetical protein RL030_303, partial [Pseudomonadota bacterium]
MIIKGKSRSGAASLAAHLTSTNNERVTVAELRGVIAQDLRGALREMEDVASGTRCRLFLYHASLAPDARYFLTPAQWREAVDALEKNLGLTNQPRAVVIHSKDGRDHCHVVWSRIDAERMKAIPDSHNFRKHEQTARDLERRFGHERVQGAHVEREGRPRPKRTPSRADIRQQERAGQSGRAAVASVKRVTAEVTALWHQTNSGQAFAAALAARGYVLAKGDRRDFVIVDSVGAVHSLARRIEGVKAAQVRERMVDVGRDSLPSVAEAKAQQIERANAVRLLACLPVATSQPRETLATTGRNHGSSTREIVETFIALCHDPLHNLPCWLDAQGRRRASGDRLLARSRAGVAGNGDVRPVRAEGRGDQALRASPAANAHQVPRQTAPKAQGAARAAEGRIRGLSSNGTESRHRGEPDIKPPRRRPGLDCVAVAV